MSVKKRIALSRDTFYDRNFKSMSKDAQLGYIQLLFNAEVSGLVFTPDDAIGTYGSAVLNELFDNGYLIETNGRTYITKNWIESKFESRWLKKLEECEDYVSGDLRFEGKVGYSKYVCEQKRQNFDKLLTPNSNGNGKGNPTGKRKCNPNPNLNDNADIRDAMKSVSCQCPRCGRRMLLGKNGSGVSEGRCEGCGTQWAYERGWSSVDAETGELVPFLGKSA